jgi:large conductance mechanosensitive channel
MHMGLVKEFREFALKGNVLDLAVGVIIGGAFGKIVASLIDDIIMPVVSIPGNVDFTNMYFGLTEKVRTAVADAAALGKPLGLADARKVGPTFAYGNFITTTINFVILAFCIFLVVKAFNAARKRFEAEKPPAAPLATPEDVLLLREIRDALKTR